VPPGLAAPGTGDARYQRLLPVSAVPAGTLHRVVVGDLDLLVASTPVGLIATEDRCPHMSAPLSLGILDGTAVDCVLHQAVIDLATGEILQFPTTGGLGPDGVEHPAWAPPGSPPRPERTDAKARARALTRTRRPRYYPVRIREGWVEVAVPDASP
jgi:nitrite reductase/ring-hydroxylating ferredoxin subunit